MQSKIISKSKHGFSRGQLFFGPLLFLVYVLLLRYLIRRHSISRHYNLYLKYPEQVQAVAHSREQCLEDVKSWMVNNKLELSGSKVEVPVVVRKQQRYCIQNIKLKVRDSEIVPSKCVRNMFDEELAMVNQVSRHPKTW